MKTPEFEKYPENEPNYNDVNYLVIINYLNHDSYAFRYYNGETFLKEYEGEEILAFCETDPHKIIISLNLK